MLQFSQSQIHQESWEKEQLSYFFFSQILVYVFCSTKTKNGGNMFPVEKRHFSLTQTLLNLNTNSTQTQFELVTQIAHPVDIYREITGYILKHLILLD